MEWDRKKRKFDWKRAIKMKGVHESMKQCGGYVRLYLLTKEK